MVFVMNGNGEKHKPAARSVPLLLVNVSPFKDLAPRHAAFITDDFYCRNAGERSGGERRLPVVDISRAAQQAIGRRGLHRVGLTQETSSCLCGACFENEIWNYAR